MSQLRFEGVPDVRTTPASLTNIAGGDIVDKINSALQMVARIIGENGNNGTTDMFAAGSEYKIRAEITIAPESQEKIDVSGDVRIILPGMRGVKTSMFFGRNRQFVIPVVNREDFERED